MSSVRTFAARRTLLARLVRTLTVAFFVGAVAVPTWAAEPVARTAEGFEYQPGVVLVRWRDGWNPASASRSAEFLATAKGVGVAGIRPLAPAGPGARSAGPATDFMSSLCRVELADPERTLEAVAAFIRLPDVERAEPLYLLRLNDVPDDPMFEDQQYLERIGAPEAWNVTTGIPSVVVAVIDTGLDLDHEDLAGQSWVNPSEIAGDANGDGAPGFAGFDDDDDGLMDEDSQGRQPGDAGYNNDLSTSPRKCQAH